MHTLWHILLDFLYFCDNSYNLPSAYLVELPTIQRFWSLQIASGNLHVFYLYQVHPMQEVGFKLYFGELHLIEEFHLCCYISFDAIFSQGYQKILTKCFKVVTTNFVFSTDCFCPCTTSQPSKPAFLLENYLQCWKYLAINWCLSFGNKRTCPCCSFEGKKDELAVTLENIYQLVFSQNTVLQVGKISILRQ